MTRAELRRNWEIWRRLVAQSASVALVYRAQSVIWMIGGLLPLAMMLIWMQIAANGPKSGYDAEDFALYFLSIFLVRQLTPMWAVLLLDRGIRQGELSPRLLRPMPPIWEHLADHIGELVLRAPLAVAIFTAGLVAVGAADRLTPLHVLLFLPAMAGSWLLLFNLYYCIGLAAFWVDNVLAFEGLYWSLYLILGGSVVPVDLFPAAMRGILHLLPFATCLDFPAQVLLGKLDGPLLLKGYGLLIGWLACVVILRRGLWRRGLTRFSAAGA